MVISPLETQQDGILTGKLLKKKKTHTHREREKEGLTTFFSIWNTTAINFLHFWKYIRTGQWKVQSTAPKYWICPSMNPSPLSTSKDLVEVIYKFTRNTYQRKSSKHISLEKQVNGREANQMYIGNLSKLTTLLFENKI